MQPEEGESVGGTNSSNANVLSNPNSGIQTQSGRVSRPPERLIEEIGGMGVAGLNITALEMQYLLYLMNLQMNEYDRNDIQFNLVGAGIGDGIANTKELRVMKFKEAMATNDSDKWLEAVEEEYKKMTGMNVWHSVNVDKLPRNSRVLSTTWAMKKKANGTYRARLTGRGYEQVEGVHYDSTATSSPVTNDMSIRIIMILGLMAGWDCQLKDVVGAFWMES